MRTSSIDFRWFWHPQARYLWLLTNILQMKLRLNHKTKENRTISARTFNSNFKAHPMEAYFFSRIPCHSGHIHIKQPLNPKWTKTKRRGAQQPQNINLFRVQPATPQRHPKWFPETIYIGTRGRSREKRNKKIISWESKPHSLDFQPSLRFPICNPQRDP